MKSLAVVVIEREKELVFGRKHFHLRRNQSTMRWLTPPPPLILDELLAFPVVWAVSERKGLGSTTNSHAVLQGVMCQGFSKRKCSAGRCRAARDWEQFRYRATLKTITSGPYTSGADGPTSSSQRIAKFPPYSCG